MSNAIINLARNIKIEIYGNDNIVQVGQNCHSDIASTICIGFPNVPISNCKVIIGNNTTFAGFLLRINESNTIVTIGENCMFSSGINIWASDTHTVLDSSGKICNIGNHIHIGNHVWVGMNSTILKNTTIPDNSIVGFGAVVSGDKFTETGSIIVGNPARAVKTGYNWDRMRPQQWIESH